MKNLDPTEMVLPAVERAALASRPLRIIFICTGNICRSPLAHAVFNHAVMQRQLTGLFELESAGTHGYHIGDNADPRMRACARRHGVVLDHGARKLVSTDIEYYDLLLAMDHEHLAWLREMDKIGNARERIMLYREFDQESNRGLDVPDPYYDGQDAFELVWRIADNCTAQLLETLVSTMKTRA